MKQHNNFRRNLMQKINTVIRFRRLVESKPSYKASAEKQQNWKSNVFFAPKQDRKRGGRHHSTLADQPCNKTAQTILKPQAEELEKFAAGQKLSNEEALKNGVTGKFGIDGSGTHKVRHQLVNELLSLLENPHLDPKKTSSFLLSGYCPLKITCLHATIIRPDSGVQVKYRKKPWQNTEKYRKKYRKIRRNTIFYPRQMIINALFIPMLICSSILRHAYLLPQPTLPSKLLDKQTRREETLLTNNPLAYKRYTVPTL